MNHTLYLLINGHYHLPVIYSVNSTIDTTDKEAGENHPDPYPNNQFARCINACNGLDVQYQLVSLTRSVEEIYSTCPTLSTSFIAFKIVTTGSF